MEPLAKMPLLLLLMLQRLRRHLSHASRLVAEQVTSRHLPSRSSQKCGAEMEIPDRYLEQALADKIEELAGDMLLGENAELLWAEIERMTLSRARADIDGLRDMSVADIAERVAEQIAGRMLDAGDLDEAACDLAAEDALIAELNETSEDRP